MSFSDIYTAHLDANTFFRKNGSISQDVILKNGKKGFSIKSQNKGKPIGGFWTEEGKIITYWD